LLVPSRAITRKGQTSTVQVIKGTVTETRNVKTGITDGTNTEITDGLTEGEQVAYTSSTSSSTSSNNQNRNNIDFGGPGIRLP
jgi:multidrug efflux pump subunit AcrA (membrane-fusion protein)